MRWASTKWKRRLDALRIDVTGVGAVGAVGGISAGVICATAVASLILDVDPGDFSRDPNADSGEPVYVGALSQASVAGWAIAAAFGIFTWWVARHRDRNVARLMLAVGLFAAVLGADDLLLLHENVVPEFLGLDEHVVSALYAVVAIGIASTFRSAALRTPAFVALTAVGVLGFAVLVDVASEPLDDVLGRWRVLVEDGAKFSGILMLAGWTAVTSASFVGDGRPES